MHKEVLSKDQLALLPLIKVFSAEFGLVGGTAIALHLGHRRSIDFDLFTNKEFSNEAIRNKVKDTYTIQATIIDKPGELTLVSGNVKMTFYIFPYKINYTDKFDGIIKIPNLLTLAAMKAFALGRRAKWKDYVDIFFILKDCAFDDITRKSREMFGPEFNERLFREQLSYYADIDYSEKVEYMLDKQVPNAEIKQRLSALSLR